MQALGQKKLYRIIDANFNRAKEGLRVCEDICRFILDKKEITRSYKVLRHQLTEIISSLKISKIIQSREIAGDVGRQNLAIEFKRKNVNDIFYANSQRVKESIRVLEEFSKLFSGQSKTFAQDLKKIRYKIYALEKKIVEGC